MRSVIMDRGGIRSRNFPFAIGENMHFSPRIEREKGCSVVLPTMKDLEERLRGKAREVRCLRYDLSVTFLQNALTNLQGVP